MNFRSIGPRFGAPFRGPRFSLARPTESSHRFPEHRIEQFRRDIEEVLTVPGPFSTPLTKRVLLGFERPPPGSAKEKAALQQRREPQRIWHKEERLRQWHAALIPDLHTLERWISTLHTKIDGELDCEPLTEGHAAAVGTYAVILQDLSLAWESCHSPIPGARPDPAWRMTPDLLRRNRGVHERVQISSGVMAHHSQIALILFSASQALREASERIAGHSLEAYQHTWRPEMILRLRQFDAVAATVEGIRTINLGADEYGDFVDLVDEFCLQDPRATAGWLEQRAWRRSGGNAVEFQNWKRVYFQLMDHFTETLGRFISEQSPLVEPHLSDERIERLVRFPFTFRRHFPNGRFSFHFIDSEQSYRGAFSPLEERILRQMLKEGRVRFAPLDDQAFLRPTLLYAGTASFLHHHCGIPLSQSEEIRRFFDGGDLPDLLRMNRSVPLKSRAISVSQWFHFAKGCGLFASGDKARVIHGLAEWIGKDQLKILPEDDLGIF